MIVLSIIAYGGPALLALLGIVVTGNPPSSKRARFTWYAVFGVILVASVAAAVIDTSQREKKIAEMLTGGDNYGYLSAEVDSMKNTTDPVPVWFQASGLLFGVNYWIAPGGVSDPNNNLYWSIGGGYIPETRGGFRIGKSLLPGKYRIEISARNGSTVQTLEIKEVGGKLVQLIDVFRHGEGKIFSNH